MTTSNVAIVELCGTVMGNNILRVVWDGDASELEDAIRVCKSQTKERWTQVMFTISADSATEIYRKRGSKTEFPQQAIVNVQRNLRKLAEAV